MKFLLSAPLLGAAALVALSSPAVAQDNSGGTIDNQSDAEAQAAMLQAQLEALQAQLDSLKGRMKKQEDGKNWRGSPQFVDKDAGWEFKVRGRFMYDTAYLVQPDELAKDNRYGLRSGFRRVRLGAEGKLPGGFGYSAEFDFADSAVGFGDVILTYQATNSPFRVILGNHETWQSLEQITSSRYISFLERSQGNEAWGVGRRLGASVQYRKNDLLLSGGIFNEAIPSGTDNTGLNDGWLFGTRWNYNPKWNDNQLHFGANFNYRNFREASLGNRYRARPFGSRPTDIRFVDTGNLAGKSDMTYGLEAGGIFGPLHVVAEAQLLTLNALKPADVVAAPATVNGTRLTGNPTFVTAYGEVGYFFTGEKRGYNAGTARWDRTKVLNPFDKGGWGAWQAVARVDYLNLTDDVGAAVAPGTGITAGTCVTATAGARCIVNGGKQLGILAGLNWYPTDYVRFMLDYHYVDVSGVSISTAKALSSGVGIAKSTAGLDTSVFSFRAAFDF